MKEHINHVLMLLEDAGLKLCYPRFIEVNLNQDDTQIYNLKFSIRESGNRVTIEQNISLKLLIIFSIFDLFLDQQHPELSGKSFYAKYRGLPENNEYEQILKSLFRIAKVMRNALVHNQSAINYEDDFLDINYHFHKTNFRLRLTYSALNYFFTVIIMYLKQDLGPRDYFQGIINSLYNDMILGIKEFNDEFDVSLFVCNGLRLLRISRNRVYFKDYEIQTNMLIFPEYKPDYPEREGVDYCLVLNDSKYIIPKEVLNSNLSINIDEIEKWKVDSA